MKSMKNTKNIKRKLAAIGLLVTLPVAALISTRVRAASVSWQDTRIVNHR